MCSRPTLWKKNLQASLASRGNPATGASYADTMCLFSVNVFILLRRFNLDPAACSLKLQVRIALNLNEGYA